MQAQEEKVQILAAIQASLPAITKKATLLWAAGVATPDAAIITGAATSSLEEPGSSSRGKPQGPRTFVGALAPPSHQITCTSEPPGSARQLPHSW